MLVTVFCAPRDRPETTFALDVSPELELRDFVALCELESGIPAGEIQITYVEQPLKDPTRALGTYGVKDGDVVVLRQAERRPPPTQPAFPGLPRIDFRSITVPGTSPSTSQRGAVRPPPPPPQQQQQQQQQQQAPQQQAPQQPSATQPSTPAAFHGSSPQGLDDPALLQQMLLSNPHELSLLKERNPPLAEALLSGDLERFTKVLLEQQQDRAKRERERIRLLTADPFDLEAQAKIEEDIRQHNVEENMTIAMEEAPESFGQVVMLYINCKVNGHPVKAFVDSGAQMTIMSQACAERCNIMRLVDRRWAGIAKGVGTQKIIGRVHLAQVQIEGDFLPCSFSILEDQPMDMLLGLDMLKRHQCSIDLKKNVLVIGTTGTETRFLSEAELPECARLAYGAEGREDARPEEMADRELAEALQRSIQESVESNQNAATELQRVQVQNAALAEDSTDAFGDSWRGPYQPDTADGQTTSPKLPPFTLPRTLHQTSSPDSPPQSQPQNPILDRSHSAPATLEQVTRARQRQGQPGLPELPRPSSPAGEARPPQSALAHPLPGYNTSDVLSAPGPSTDVPRARSPLPDVSSASQDPGGDVQPGAAQRDAGSDRAQGSSAHTTSEELPPAQPMEQEFTESIADATEACPAAPGQPGSVEMESPSASCSAGSSEKDQPDGDRRSSSDNIPSLAAALMELHELLVSSNHAQPQSRSASCSPSCPPQQQQDSDCESRTPTPENSQPARPASIKAGAETSDAKAHYAATASDQEPAQFLVSDLSGRDEHPGGGPAETAERRGPSQCPDVSEGRGEGERSLNETLRVSVSQPETEAPPECPVKDLEFREQPEGQRGGGAADGQAPVSNTRDGLLTRHPLLGPSSAAEGSPDEVSSSSSSSAPAPLPLPPHPFIEQFPAEHIQRIQAAGFSAREAVEALEQAHGVVEIALLALLARSITVPT